MKTSVVMACFNGEKRIWKQLESLRKQTRPIDEVILIDDCSTDNTANVVREYIYSNHLTGWLFQTNETNIGWKANFFQALALATGDVIFPCDQDDEWDETKIEQMESVMEANSGIDILACDYCVEYETGAVKIKKYKKSPEEQQGRISLYRFTSRFFQNPSPGCTYAIKKTFLDHVKSYWFPEAPYDEFLWLLAATTGSTWFLNECLVSQHRYENNASDIRYKDIPMQKENLLNIEKMLGLMEAYAAERKDSVDPKKTVMIQKAKTWCRKRQKLMDNRNPFYWLAMMPYWKYYNSFRNCLSDLFLALFGSFKRV